MSTDKNAFRRRHAGTAAGAKIHIIRTDAAQHRRTMRNLASVDAACTAWLLANAPTFKEGWRNNNLWNT